MMNEQHEVNCTEENANFTNALFNKSFHEAQLDIEMLEAK